MASIKDLKKRIGSTKNTQQTTKAMKMVSAAKLRRGQEAITNQRPYAHRIKSLVERLLHTPQLKFESPLIRTEAPATQGRLLLVVVTSDRGLCGGFNSNIIKGAQRWVDANGAAYASVELAFVGRRGYDFFKNKVSSIGPYYSELGGKVTYDKAKKLADNLSELFLSGQVDEVKFIYNEFKNAITQTVNVEHFLPLIPEKLENKPVVASESEQPDAYYIVRPSLEEVLKSLVGKYFSIQAFRILLESQASEHGARMSAMENATKNAGEMIRKLTLQYNKQRQANITKELLEIIAGSESQKVS